MLFPNLPAFFPIQEVCLVQVSLKCQTNPYTILLFVTVRGMLEPLSEDTPVFVSVLIGTFVSQLKNTVQVVLSLQY